MEKAVSTTMKILIVNTHDLTGGAARAAYRLHEGLLANDVESIMLVQNKTSNSPTVIAPNGLINKIRKRLKSTLDKSLVNKNTEKHDVIFSTAWVSSGEIVKMINAFDADIVHLHWIHEGMISIEDLPKINKPIVWSLHDMWAFSGGCHYDEECGKYNKYCSSCPVLGSSNSKDLSYKIFTRKEKSYFKIKDLTIIGLSQWLTHCAQSSHLFQKRHVVNLPNPINSSKMCPIDKNIAKEILGISKEKKLLLFGAVGINSDPRKGFQELLKSLNSLKIPNIEIMIFGAATPSNPINDKFTVHYTGHLVDDLSLRIIYSAANVVIVPSLQENLSNVVMEALSCATPVVAFNIGGNSDMIEHQKNGYLANPFDTDDLAFGIDWVIENEQYDSLCLKAREKVLNNFDSKIVVNKYLTLYQEILNNPKES